MGFGLCSALLLPVMAAILFVLWFRIALPQGVLEWVIGLAESAFAGGGVGTYFVCCLVSAITKPRRMEAHLAVVARRVGRIATVALLAALAAFLVVVLGPMLLAPLR